MRSGCVSPYPDAVNRVETRRAAKALGMVAVPGTVVGLEGELGAGKTFFVEALARGLGVPRSVAVTSPTFTIVHVVPGGRLPLYHVDLYRLDREADLRELGLEEMISGGGVTAIEWWSRLGAARPSDAIVVEIEVRGARERELRVSATGRIATEVLRRWLDATRSVLQGSA